MHAQSYVGRFAPSPTGALHAGSMVAALASWLDARAWNQGRGGCWLVRIEDLDQQRCVPGAAETILRQLHDCALIPDEAPQWQSRRSDRYVRARDQLVAADRAYGCACSRADIAAALQRQGRSRKRHGELVYPGTCRDGLHGSTALAWRLRVTPRARVAPGEPAPADAATGTASDMLRWCDRRLGAQRQDVAQEVGDFVIQRADGPFAYQLAVVVDDAAQQVSHVVRGADLCDNTARQIVLQQALGLPTPQYLHTPLVLGADGHKLSKQNGARALDTRNPLAALQAAAAVLGLPSHDGPVGDALPTWVGAWRDLYNPRV